MGEVYVTRSSMPPLDEYLAEIAPLWESRWLTNMGAKHRQLEQELVAYLGTRCVTLFTNGHSAIECTLETMQLAGEVITTPFTFASTTHAIVRKGLTPVMCDIRPSDCTIDPDAIEPLITERTCAIMPVHVYGNLCDVDAIQAIADAHHLKVVYDAAHAFGVFRGQTSSARFGDASIFSFHATKVFNTIEGGAVCYADMSLTEPLEQWKNFGITGPETVRYAGGNAKMNEFCAAMGLCNLRHLDDEIERRGVVEDRYRERLEDVCGIAFLTPRRDDVRPNHAYVPVTFDPTRFGATRDAVFDALARRGMHARKYFYPCTNEYECYRGVLDPTSTPVAHEVARRVLTLPIYADLPITCVDRICDAIIDVPTTA